MPTDLIERIGIKPAIPAAVMGIIKHLSVNDEWEHIPHISGYGKHHLPNSSSF